MTTITIPDPPAGYGPGRPYSPCGMLVWVSYLSPDGERMAQWYPGRATGGPRWRYFQYNHGVYEPVDPPSQA